MSGLPNLNFPAFNAEAARLRALGYDVVNPAEINGGADEVAATANMTPEQYRAHWRQCMRRDIAQLLTCDSIVLLEGYERSKGASLEAYIGIELGMEVCMARDVVEPCLDSPARVGHWEKVAGGLETLRLNEQAEGDKARAFVAGVTAGAVEAGGAQ